MSATVVHSSSAEVDQVVAAAVGAASALADASPRQRRDWLYAIADVLEDHRDELADLADDETALGLERLRGEVERTVGQLRFYGDVAVEGSHFGATIDSPSSAFPQIARVNVPLGPVAVFGASNFPLAFSVLGNDTASALAAGCPVVVKAHPAHLSVSQRVCDLAREALSAAGAPAGMLGMVFGLEAGRWLVQHPDIEAVGFTGSQAGGMALWRLANQRGKVIPVYAEMGTVNPVVATPAMSSEMALVAEGLVASFTLGAGQFCTKPGLLLAPKGADAARLVGDALVTSAPSAVALTRDIADRLTTDIDELEAAGCVVVGRVDGPAGGWGAPAAVLQAPLHVFRPGHRALAECFGAVIVVVEYSTLEEAHAVIDQLQGALAGSVFAAPQDPDAAILVEAVAKKVGRVIVNGWPTGVAYSWAQQHGGPWPSTTQPGATSVGAAALQRFGRPVAYQGVPDAALPAALRAANPWNIARRVDGDLRQEDEQ